ncbi:hypothetical protein [Micromonospora sp. NPDC049891]|uniref:hypothetical protein n=1 Tax=Micromonospora sp. NPDC049891 TaxID=3155655 RepID=UPI0033E8AA4B
MAKGTKAAIRKARAKGVTGLAWASAVVALVGGTLGAGIWFGDAIVAVLNWIPWGWLPEVLLFVGVVAIGLDMFLDGVPNQVAIAGAILVPSIARATSGKLGDTITDWTGDLVDWMGEWMTEWIGTDSATGLALASIVCAVLMARRVIKKSRRSDLAEV